LTVKRKTVKIKRTINFSIFLRLINFSDNFSDPAMCSWLFISHYCTSNISYRILSLFQCTGHIYEPKKLT